MGGIQVWMLTGDKVETAKCIAMSAGFKSRNQ
jgi:phospholipid-translocating ATPase